MNTTDNDREIKERKNAQWKLHQQIAQFAASLDRLQDAQEVRDDKPTPVPAHLIKMIF